MTPPLLLAFGRTSWQRPGTARQLLVAGGGDALPGPRRPRCAKPWPELPGVTGTADSLCHPGHSGAHYTHRGYRGRRRLGRLSQRPAQVLEADDLADRAGHLAQAGLAVILGGARRVHHATVQVIGEQPDRDLLQGPGDRGDLDDHVGAVAVGVDHLLQAANLAFDLGEPGQVVRLARGVPAADALAAGRGGRAARPGPERRALAWAGGGQGAHRAPPAPEGLSLRPEPIRSCSRLYSSMSISPRARRSSRIPSALPG